MIWFQFESEGLRNRRAAGLNASLGASSLEIQVEQGFSSHPKARRTEVPTQAVRQEEFLLTQPFCLRSSTNCMRPTHIGEGSLLYSRLLIQMLISSRDTLTHQE